MNNVVSLLDPYGTLFEHTPQLSCTDFPPRHLRDGKDISELWKDSSTKPATTTEQQQHRSGHIQWLRVVVGGGGAAVIAVSTHRTDATGLWTHACCCHRARASFLSLHHACRPALFGTTPLPQPFPSLSITVCCSFCVPRCLPLSASFYFRCLDCLLAYVPDGCSSTTTSSILHRSH